MIGRSLASSIRRQVPRSWRGTRAEDRCLDLVQEYEERISSSLGHRARLARPRLITGERDALGMVSIAFRAGTCRCRLYRDPSMRDALLDIVDGKGRSKKVFLDHLREGTLGTILGVCLDGKGWRECCGDEGRAVDRWQDKLREMAVRPGSIDLG